MPRRVAWAAVALSAVFVTTQTVMVAQHYTLYSGDTLVHAAWPAVPAAALGSAVMGALILSRLPRHPIGWLLSASGVVTAFSMMVGEYGDWYFQGDGPGPLWLARAATWSGAMTGASVTLTMVSLIYLLAPDGRLPSRRWRPAVWTALAGGAVYAAGVLTFNPARIPTDGSEPDFLTVTKVLAVVGTLLNLAGLVSAAACLVLRLRRAAGIERQQLRWMAVAAVALAFGIVFLVVAQALDVSDVSGVPLYLAYFALPICTAVSVLRYRLFDLDVFLNRAIVLTLATAVVGVGYVALVVGISSAVGRGTERFWQSLLATAVVALAFQPLRRGVVRLANRLAYGPAAVPYEALAELSRRLGDSPDPTGLLPALAEAAARAVGADRATARLEAPGGAEEAASWPARAARPGGDAVSVDVVDLGERLGSVTVELAPGRSLRPADGRLLRDLADQAGIAFRNARLTAELAARVDELAQQTIDLAESRRRLITAEDAELSRLERAIARDVVPHLRPLPDRLRALSLPGALRPTARSVLPSLVAAANEALEALREITRGVFPAQLERFGLEAALSSHLGRARGGRLTVDATVAGRRFDPAVEAAAYFCAVEVARELGSAVEVSLMANGTDLCLRITGVDGAEDNVDNSADSGVAALRDRVEVAAMRDSVEVAALRDRVEAVDGSVTRVSAEGRTVVEVRLPIRAGAAVST